MSATTRTMKDIQSDTEVELSEIDGKMKNRSRETTFGTECTKTETEADIMSKVG
jgi:hypothetical protein